MAKAKAEEGLPSKTKMVEAAMDTLGMDSSPATIQPWVLEKYKVEIDKQMISSYASTYRKKRGAGKSGSIRVSAATSGKGVVGVKDVQLLSELIDRVGSNEVQTLVKVLAK
jgi:hypothetical protein